MTVLTGRTTDTAYELDNGRTSQRSRPDGDASDAADLPRADVKHEMPDPQRKDLGADRLLGGLEATSARATHRGPSITFLSASKGPPG
jgi:hypothetical protein